MGREEVEGQESAAAGILCGMGSILCHAGVMLAPGLVVRIVLHLEIFFATARVWADGRLHCILSMDRLDVAARSLFPTDPFVT